MTSRLFYFNPTCEMAVLNGSRTYTPPRHLRDFEKELSLIPMWLASAEDIVLTEKGCSADFIDTIRNWGVQAPQFLLFSEGGADSVRNIGTSSVLCGDTKGATNLPEDCAEETLAADDISHLRKNRACLSAGSGIELHPWGWSPAVHRKLEPFKASNWDHPMAEWKEDHKLLLSRFTCNELIGAIYEEAKSLSLIEIPSIPIEIRTLDELRRAEAEEELPLLLKTPWSASGRGLFRIRSRAENAAGNTWVLGKLRQHGALLAEPMLDKLLDLSFHYWSGPDGIEFRGVNLFNTDPAGQFEGCLVNPHKEVVPEGFPFDEAVEQAISLLLRGLQSIDLHHRYHGPVGIDALIYRNKDGQVKLHPAIEINLRYTMGLVNLRLADKISPQSGGSWIIKRLKVSEWQNLVRNNPPQLRHGLFYSGVFHLTPPPETEGFMAILTLEGQ